jgi:hypothetical protein
LAWLEGRAAALGPRVGVGTVVRGVVRAAMEREAEVTGGVGRVRGGAAPVSPSGAAPARLVRLEVVVARLLRPGAGPIAPVDLVAARRRIAGGGVDVSGRGAGELEPGLLVGAGEVVLR